MNMNMNMLFFILLIILLIIFNIKVKENFYLNKEILEKNHKELIKDESNSYLSEYKCLDYGDLII